MQSSLSSENNMHVDSFKTATMQNFFRDNYIMSLLASLFIRTQDTRRKLYASYLFLSLSSLACNAQQIHTDILTNCEHRDKNLSTYTYKWIENQHVAFSGVGRDILDAKKNEIEKKIRAEAKSVPTLSPQEVEQRVQDEVKMSETLGTAVDKEVVSSYTFERYNSLTHAFSMHASISGENPSDVHEIHSDNAAMYFDLPFKLKSGIIIRPENPIVVGSSANSIYKTVGDNKHLNLSPAGFGFLMNSNLLKSYNSSWKYISEKNGNPLFSNVFEYYPGEPEEYELVLDKEHGFAPSSLKRKVRKAEIVYSTTHFRKLETEWIPDVVEVESSLGWHSKSVWTLIKVEKTKPLKFTLPPNALMTVFDTRLKGNDLNQKAMEKTINSDDPDFVQYVWDGHLPTMDELRAMRTKQHMRDEHNFGSSPSPTIWMLFAGLLFTGIGAFLKFKKYRNSKISNDKQQK